MLVRLLAGILCAGVACAAHADDIDDGSMEGHGGRRPAPHAEPAHTAPEPAHAGGHHHGDGPGRPDGHAPIGVMGEHMHPKGGAMLSYRYMFMAMDGNREGTTRKGTRNVLRAFPVAPTEMDMEMHMFGGMWAPLDQVTLTLMVPIVRIDMDHRTRMGRKFTTRANGLGDIKVGALVGVYDDEIHHVHLNLGVSTPTGSIRQKDDTPMGRMRLPYPMQLGSGTWDLLPGVTYTGKVEDWSWGAQAMGTIRTGKNDNGYRLGDAYEATAWGARRWSEWLSTSLRLAWRDWNQIHGDDDELNRNVVPTADPNLRKGRRLDALVGINLIVPRGFLRGNRLAVEFGYPVWQHLRGPQLETDWILTAGWQYAF